MMLKDIRLSPRRIRTVSNWLLRDAITLAGGEEALREIATGYITGAARDKKQQAVINLLYERWGMLVALGERGCVFEFDEATQTMKGCGCLENGG